MAAPTAASTPAVGTLKDAKAPFDLDELVAELLAPVPVPVPLALVWDAEEDSGGVAEEAGYVAPKALTSKGCETARIFLWSMGSAKTRVYPVAGIKLACWVVIVWEQSALGTCATIASAAVKTVGVVLFSKSWNALLVVVGTSV